MLDHEQEARRRLSAFDVGRHEVVDTVLLAGRLHYAAWMGVPADGLHLARAVLIGRHDEVSPGTAGDLLVLTARAAADATIAGGRLRAKGRRPQPRRPPGGDAP